jgi:DNA helicase-2/ATP-dependent DNA helicase PcrA
MTLTSPDELPRVLGIPLSAEQLAAATAPLAPQLIVAGAGTGKTTVMAARVVWLVGSGAVAAHRVLGLTFTRKAAAELRHRVRSSLARLPGGAHEDVAPTIATYHAFAGQLLSEFGPLLGVEPDAHELADAQRSRLAYATACAPVAADGLSGSVVTLAGRIRIMDDALADLDIDPAALRDHDMQLIAHLAAAQGPQSLLRSMVAAAEARITLSRLVDQFRNAKSAGEFLDFADIVRLAAALARDVPMVAERMAQRFGVVLLDEYQDTSRAQRRMLQSLFGAGHPVTAVGDPCQAIYGWRGASVTNIDQFPTHFPAHDGDPAGVHVLTINRRSGEAVLAAANRVSAQLRGIHPEVRPLTAPADVPPAALRCALLQTFHDEVLWLGEQVVAEGTRRPWADLAVLCRTNGQAGAVADHLRDQGVPVLLASRQEVLASPEVGWVTSLLQVMVDPFANPELVHHLTGPRWRIGARDLAILGRRARDLAEPSSEAGVLDPDISLLDAVGDPGPADRYGYSAEARERFAAFRGELDHLGRLRDRPVAEVVAAAVELLSPLLLHPGDSSIPGALTALMELAHGFRSLEGGRGMAEFVTYLDDCRRFASGPQLAAALAGPGVRVMTVHAAKGLEFPVVFLPFLADGSFPDTGGTSRWPTSSLAIPPVASDEPDIAIALGFPGEQFSTSHHKDYVAAARAEDRLDEDRLAYVAVTRAREVLVASGHWWGQTQARPRGPSDYLQAVAAACRAGGGVIDRWCDEAGDNPAEVRVGGQQVTWPAPAVDPEAAAFAVDVCAADPASPLPGPFAREIGALLALRQDAAAPAHAVPLPEVLSVSQLLQWHRDPQRFLADLARPVPTRPSPAADRGVRFHAWVEQRMGQQELFDLAEWLGDTDTAAEHREFADLFARTRFADRGPAAVEHPFVIEAEGTVLTGRIDAVFRCSDDPRFDWEVVDWKSGRVDRADPLQLAVYARAWAAAVDCPVARIRGTFVQLSDGAERRFAPLPALSLPASPPD